MSISPAFVLACFIIVIVPGPSVTLIIANALRSGMRAGLLSVAGTQAGLAVMILIVATGLETVVALMGQAFFWVKLAGAAYLVWLGLKLLRSDGKLDRAGNGGAPRTGYFWQGFFVVLANPKALLFFGAFIPQFIDPASGAFQQTLLLGFVFMAVATVCDSAYAVMAAKAGEMLARSRVRMLEITSGICLIFGGLWLATVRQN